MNEEINAKYGNHRTVVFYTHISDQYAPFHIKVINSTIRDATHVLDGLLYHETDLQIEEHFTDTNGYTEQVFAICHLLGFRFCSRMRDLASKKLYAFDDVDSDSPLTPMLGSIPIFKKDRSEKINSRVILAKKVSFINLGIRLLPVQIHN